MPDQTGFLERWYEFHRGYRVVKKEDGNDERVAVLGEQMKEVSPGCLPRTVEEMREGRRREEEVAAQVREGEGEVVEETGPSLDDTLESMFQAASLEESAEGGRTEQARQEPTLPELPGDAERRLRNNVHAQAMVPAGSRSREYQARRVAALRRELHRMRNGIERVISGLRDLGENVPDHSQATTNLAELGRTLDTINGGPSEEDSERAINSVNQLASNTAMSQSDRTLANMQSRVDTARNQVNEARRARDQAASELDLAETEFQSSQGRLQQLQREHRTAENYMRIFGTREEMMAQGENYESPIGGMFRRADERFRVAEDVRREERTLRQVLEDEARAGGEEDSRLLAELEGRPRDVWGVPRPRDARVDQIDGRERERAIQRGVSTVAGVGMLRHYPQRYTSRTQPNTQYEDAVASVQPPQGEETELEEYYRMMRQQEGAQLSPESSDEHRATGDDFPRSMLNALMETRREESAELEAAGIPSGTVPPGRYFDAELDEWWRQDVEFMVAALLNNDQLRESLQLDEQKLRDQLRDMRQGVSDPDDQAEIDALLSRDDVVWQIGLPGEWLERRKAATQHPTHENIAFPMRGIGGRDQANNVFSVHYSPYLLTEMVAQAFQMSAEVRRHALDLNAPERLSMLYRLQAGHREERDVSVLEHLQRDDETREFALRTYDNSFSGQHGETDFVRRYDDLRRQRARQGDHSRQELDANRQATSAFALAAGRQAMQTGPHTLLERMAERDAETRAAYQRLQANGFTTTPPASATATRNRPTLYRQLTLDDYGVPIPSDTDTDSEEVDEEQGLDARDTGRPEPKSDEEMTMQMDCKICYTQVAEVACLPCGHLVMCRWCSEQHSPVLLHDRTRPRRAAGCPVCRKGVRSKVRVFRV